MGSLLPLHVAPDGRNLREKALPAAPDATDEHEIDHDSARHNPKEECDPAPSVHRGNLLALRIGISDLAQESLEELGYL